MSDSVKDNRRNINERRKFSLEENYKTVDRRKKPERRLEGINVDVINLSDEDFSEYFKEHPHS